MLCALFFAMGTRAQGVGAKTDSLPAKQLSPAETRLKLTGMLHSVDSAYKSLMNKYRGTREAELPKIEYESERLDSAAVAGYQEARLVNDVGGSGDLKQAVLTWTNSLMNFIFTIRTPLGDDNKENFQRYQLRKKDVDASVIELARQRQLIDVAVAAYVKNNHIE
jgi:hypothetical protein